MKNMKKLCTGQCFKHVSTLSSIFTKAKALHDLGLPNAFLGSLMNFTFEDIPYNYWVLKGVEHFRPIGDLLQTLEYMSSNSVSQDKTRCGQILIALWT